MMTTKILITVSMVIGGFLMIIAITHFPSNTKCRGKDIRVDDEWGSAVTVKRAAIRNVGSRSDADPPLISTERKGEWLLYLCLFLILFIAIFAWFLMSY